MSSPSDHQPESWETGELGHPNRSACAPGVEMRELRLQIARRSITERRRITQRLRQALNIGAFLLHYQPQIELRSGRMRGAQALIRLTHRRRGLILPGHFMPVAEKTDIIHDIGGWILTRACMDAARWPGNASLVAVSLSPRQLQSSRLIKYLLEALGRSGLEACRLELDLTEAMLIDDNEDAFFSLKALRGLGVRLAINDFGVGYASLSALRRLPLSTLKLNRSLTQDLGTNDADTAIIHAAVKAGHALGCTVLADGVETAAQCQAVLAIGCDEGQGPYFGPALSAEDLMPLLSLDG